MTVREPRSVVYNDSEMALARTGRTVLGPDEVSLESVSVALARGPVVIRATDEQARQIMERHRGDAFPPE